MKKKTAKIHRHVNVRKSRKSLYSQINNRLKSISFVFFLRNIPIKQNFCAKIIKKKNKKVSCLYYQENLPFSSFFFILIF